MTIECSIEELSMMSARINLSQFVLTEARRTANELGFGWRAAVLAPTGLDEATEELRACHVIGSSFRVYAGASDDTIYDCPETNYAYRFWHDTRHVWLGADFSADAELAVASCHLAQAKTEGFGLGTIEYQLLYADTVGQTLFMAQCHRFVENQRQFALDVVDLGMDAAITGELLRSGETGS